MKQIKLTKGKVAIVDDDTFEELNKRKWHYTLNGYAMGSTWSNGKVTKASMHRIVTKAKAGDYVDHINGDRLLNTRSNLRICTPLQNQMNRYKSKGYHMEEDGKWRVRIRVNGKAISIGKFWNEEEARDARILAEQKYFGIYAPNRGCYVRPLPFTVGKFQSWMAA